MIAPWLQRLIVHSAVFDLINIECTGFLKCTDYDRVMKSEVVPEKSAQALPYDWRFGRL
jgi:hypothetical protein